jgi:hypothetical protein
VRSSARHGPFVIGQVTRISQLATVTSPAVFRRPHTRPRESKSAATAKKRHEIGRVLEACRGAVNFDVRSLW